MKKLKQGQTIYRIDLNFHCDPMEYYVNKIFLHSHKQPLPPKQCIIEKMPVSFANEMIERSGSHNVFLSKRKAERRLKDIMHGRAQ